MTDFDLKKLEQRFLQMMKRQKPRAMYVERLKGELKNSRIFELRRSVGAILVASFGVLFAGAVSAAIAIFAQRARRRINV